MSKAKSWYYKNAPRWDGKIPPPVFSGEKKIPSRKWKKKFECKKNKGDHTFIPVTIHNGFTYTAKTPMGKCYSGHPIEPREGWILTGKNVHSYIRWECTGCKKLYTERIGGVFGEKELIPEKKMDKYRANVFKYVEYNSNPR